MEEKVKKFIKWAITRIGLQPEYDIISGFVQIPKPDLERFGFIVMFIGCVIGIAVGIMATIILDTL